MYDNSKDGSRWFESSKNDIHQDVFAYIKHLQNAQSYRSSDNLRAAKLYGNYDIQGLDAYSYTKVAASAGVSNKVTMNVVQSLIDTVVSKITKNKPRPTFLTSNGNWSLQSKAKKLTKFIDGTFSATDFYAKAEMSFLDACIFGTGCIKLFEKNGNIAAERVFIEEIVVDDIESYYSKPRQIHQQKQLHKDVIKKMFPQHKLMIDQASDDMDEFSTASSEKSKSQMLRVIESWHLPSGKDAKDGKHTISIANQTLLAEGYEKDYFPFIFFKWGKRPVGFFGQGLAEQLQGLQLEINKILRTIQVSMHLVSIPKLLVEASSKIVTSHLNNKIGGIIKYAGTPPAYAPLGGIPPELFSHLDRLYNRAYEISGISQLSAQSLKPSGLDSGKALREYNDIESERFLSVGKDYEKAFLDASKIMIDMARDLYSKNKDYKVNVKGRKFIETIKWSDVDMKEDQYMMDVFPTSALSNTPSGRLQDVQELMSAGFIGKEEGMKLLDFPDLEGTINMINADATNLEKIIEDMVENGEYFPPEPYQNLENALRKVQQAYLMYKMQGAPEDRLELLRRYMEDAQGLMMKAQVETQKQQAEAMAAAGAGQAAGVVAENAGLGEESPNALVEGDIDLDDENMFAEDLAAIEEDQMNLDDDILPEEAEAMAAEEDMMAVEE